MAIQTVNAASLTTLVNDDEITDESAEVLIDHAINLLVSYDAALSNLVGLPGAKSGTYTQKEAGAILELAVAIYSQTYVQAGASSSTVGIGGLSSSQSSSSGGKVSMITELARVLAAQLKGRRFERV